MTRTEYRFLLCSASLVPRGKAYSLDELLAGWHPARFSRETVEDLRGHSGQTRLYECGSCTFGIFHPQIIGNSSFYGEIETAYAGDWYQEWKWEFGEAISDPKSAGAFRTWGAARADSWRRRESGAPPSRGWISTNPPSPS